MKDSIFSYTPADWVIDPPIVVRNHTWIYLVVTKMDEFPYQRCEAFNFAADATANAGPNSVISMIRCWG